MAGTGDMTELRRENRLAAFDYLKRKKQATRADICKNTGLSAPTVIKIIDFFERKKLIRQTFRQEESGVGRRPVLYCLNEKENLALSLSYDGSVCRASLVNLLGQIMSSEDYPCAENLPIFLRRDLCRVVESCMAGDSGRICCAGIALPAIVHGREVSYAPYLGVTEPFALSDILTPLEARFSLPFLVENDVNAAAVGEYARRQQDGVVNMAYIAVNHGIGAGLILSSALYRGSNCFAGEIGYVNTDIHAFGSFSQRGALESRLDQQTLARRWPSAARAPGPDAEAVAYCADHLALMMSNLQCALDLDLFVLGGRRIAAFENQLIDAVNIRLCYQGASGVRCYHEKCSNPDVLGVARMSVEQWLRSLFMTD